MAPLMKAAAVAGLVAVARGHFDAEDGGWHHHHHADGEHHHHHDHDHHGEHHHGEHPGWHHHGDHGDHGEHEGWHHHGRGGRPFCPYLAKAVPMGEGYIKVVQGLLDAKNAGDCAAFGGMFAEHGNFTVTCSARHLTKELHSGAEMEQVCQRHSQEHGKKKIQLRSLFPAFTSGDAMFEVAVVDEDGAVRRTGLWQGHYCKMQKKVMRAKIIMGASQEVPAELSAAGEKFLRKVQEAGDCSALSDFLGANATVETFGEPGKLAFGDWHGKGQDEGARDMAAFQKSCEAKAGKEKRIHKSVKLAVGTTYFDEAQRELTILAQKEVVTIFRAEPVTKPVAVVLSFCPKGKITSARFYETEVVHLEAKWGAKLGHMHPTPPPTMSEEEKKVPFLGRLGQFGNWVAKKMGKTTPEEQGKPLAKQWTVKWGGKFEERLASLPEDVKQKKCEWFAKNQEFAKGKPFFEAMLEMCAELKAQKSLAPKIEDIQRKIFESADLKRDALPIGQPFEAKFMPPPTMVEDVQRKILEGADLKREAAPTGQPVKEVIVLYEAYPESSSASGLLPKAVAAALALSLTRL